MARERCYYQSAKQRCCNQRARAFLGALPRLPQKFSGNAAFSVARARRQGPALILCQQTRRGLARLELGRTFAPRSPRFVLGCAGLFADSEPLHWCADNVLLALRRGVAGATIRERLRGWARPAPSFSLPQGESTPQAGFPLLCTRCELRSVRCAPLSPRPTP